MSAREALNSALSRSVLEFLADCWDEPGAFDEWLEQIDAVARAQRDLT